MFLLRVFLSGSLVLGWSALFFKNVFFLQGEWHFEEKSSENPSWKGPLSWVPQWSNYVAQHKQTTWEPMLGPPKNLQKWPAILLGLNHSLYRVVQRYWTCSLTTNLGPKGAIWKEHAPQMCTLSVCQLWRHRAEAPIFAACFVGPLGSLTARRIFRNTNMSFEANKHHNTKNTPKINTTDMRKYIVNKATITETTKTRRQWMKEN